MTRDQIAQMAVQALQQCTSDSAQNEWIIKFAALVAAAEREACIAAIRDKGDV